MGAIRKWLFNYFRGLQHLSSSHSTAWNKAYIDGRRRNMRRDLYLRVRYWRELRAQATRGRSLPSCPHCGKTLSTYDGYTGWCTWSQTNHTGCGRSLSQPPKDEQT